MNKIALYIIIAMTVIILLPLTALAGGLNRIDNSIGPRAGGMAGAYTAVADDASLFYYNPAGILQFGAAYADFGVDVVVPRFKIERKWFSETSENDVFHLLPFGCYIQPINENLSWGVGLTVPFGLGAKFAADPLQGFYQSETLLSLTNFTPAVSWRLNDFWVIGLGLNLGYSQLKYRAPFDLNGRFIPLATDSEAEGWGVGGIVGLLYEPTEKFKWGFTYMSESKVDFRGQTKIGPGWLGFQDGFDSEFTFPSRLSAGIAYKATSKLLLALDASWYGYSQAVGDVVFDFHDLPLRKSIRLDWRDNWSTHIGGRYRLNDSWYVNGGLAYMTAAIPKETISQLTPDATGWGAAFGTSYERDHFSCHVFANYGWGEKEVNPGWNRRAPGKYEADIFTVGAAINWFF